MPYPIKREQDASANEIAQSAINPYFFVKQIIEYSIAQHGKKVIGERNAFTHGFSALAFYTVPRFNCG